MKFRIKNCEECAWWSSSKRLEPKEFCIIHERKEDQPPAIIKAIKKTKRERRIERIIYWTLTLILFTLITWNFISLFDEQKKSLIIVSSIALTLFLFFLLWVIWTIVNIEKIAQVELKELQKKKSEWIIEYEK